MMFKIVTLQCCEVLTVQLGHRECCWTTAPSSSIALLNWQIQHYHTPGPA